MDDDYKTYPPTGGFIEGDQEMETEENESIPIECLFCTDCAEREQYFMQSWECQGCGQTHVRKMVIIPNEDNVPVCDVGPDYGRPHVSFDGRQTWQGTTA